MNTAAPTEGALVLDRVGCRFGSVMPVRGATLSVADGEFVSVVGPTGCGKSTLLNMGAGLLVPSEGEVRVFGTRLRALNAKAEYLFQAESLMPWFTAADNVMLGLQARGMAREERRERAMDWLARVGLAGHEAKYPHQMNGGMRKRTALAQMLILDPKILLMDEPFSALDVQTRQLMENELLDLWQENRKSVLFVTHDLDEAIALSDRVVIMSAGPSSRVIGSFPVHLSRPRNVTEIRHVPEFIELNKQIWDVLKDEVLKGYSKTRVC